jgi:hypothetical protein
MGVFKEGICSQTTAALDLALDNLYKYRYLLMKYNDEILNFFDDMVWNAEDTIINGANTVLSNLSSMVPDVSEVDEITNILNVCVFFKEGSIPSASSLINSAVDSVYSNAESIIDGLVGVLDEFKIGGLLKSLENYISTYKIPNIVDKITKMLNCLDAICGVDITSRLQGLNQFLSDCYLDGSGQTTLWEELSDKCEGVESKINNLEAVYNSLTNTYSSIGTEITSVYNSAKEVGSTISELIF